MCVDPILYAPLPTFVQDQLPKGLAKTDALMENFYAITLTTMLRIPLLITGPPGKNVIKKCDYLL